VEPRRIATAGPVPGLVVVLVVEGGDVVGGVGSVASDVVTVVAGKVGGGAEVGAIVVRAARRIGPSSPARTSNATATATTTAASAITSRVRDRGVRIRCTTSSRGRDQLRLL
jgi:hypothetical protein